MCLDPRQNRLLERLHEKKPALGRMYKGAIQVLSQQDNPYRFSLAAHGLRELIEKFPLYADIPIRRPARLGDKVNVLCWKWERAQAANKNEEIYANRIRAFYEEFEAFLNWRKNDGSTRTQQLIETLNAIDISGRPIPQLAEKTISQLWGTLRDYFVGISHSTNTVDEVEFGKNVKFVEEFLIERIDPRPCDVCDEIDRLLASIGEGNEPSADHIERAIRLISKGNAEFDYFWFFAVFSGMPFCGVATCPRRNRA